MITRSARTSRVHLLAAMVACAFAPMASGAVLSVDAVTLSESGSPLTVEADVESVTIGQTEYTQLQGATFSVDPDNTSDGFYAYWDDDSPYVPAKVTREQALSGLNATDGTLQVDGVFTFASSLSAGSTFFLLELGSGDTVSITAVDNEGETVAVLNGDLSWGPELYRATLDRAPGDWNDEHPFVGTSFSLGDFDLETGRSFVEGTGIRIVSGGLDPAVFGLIVPEPATMGLLMVGGLALLRRRQ
jgi:hypothetical protein